MKKNWKLINFLITIFFIFLPALVGYYFYLPEWNNKSVNLWIYYVSGLIFLVYTLIISYIFIFFKITNLELINILFPLSFILVLIFISSSWPIVIRIISVLLSVFISYPTNMLVAWINKQSF